MPSETDLANDALAQASCHRIASLEDDSTAAVNCKTFLGPLRDAWLTFAHWRFAQQRQELAQDLTGPAFGFVFAYTLPPTCLKIIEYNGIDPAVLQPWGWESRIQPRWKVEGRKLYTNDATVKIVYLAQVTNPSEWSPMFYLGMGKLLASKLAAAIPKDLRKAQELEQMGQQLMLLAASIDAQQGTLTPLRIDELIWGRS